MRHAFVPALSGILLLGALVLPVRADDVELALIREAIRDKGASWTAGPNRIWDLPPHERRALLGWDRSLETREPGTVHERGEPDRLPPAWDWRNVDGDSYVTPIRDQGSCGSCWAFGALACMESRMAIDAFVPNPTVDLSEQYLVSCSPGSCNGYSISGTCEFLRTQGTPTEGCMSYQASDNVPCTSCCPWSQMELVRVQNWGWIGPNRDAIKTRVLQGPVYVAFIVYSDFQAYQGGVYEHVWGVQEGGHAVAIVGWDDALQCWICKNSWGNWGEGGYFRIKYGQCMMEDWSIWLNVELPQYPNLTVSPVTLSEIAGDGDGIANPGEQASLSFWIYNDPLWGAADALSLTLTSAGPSGGVTVTQGSASFPSSLLPGDSLLCAGALAVAISQDGPVQEVPLSLTLASQEIGMPDYRKTMTVTVAPSLDQAGWPALPTAPFYTGPACFEAGGTRCTAVADRWGTLYLLAPNGSVMPGWPVVMGDAVRGAPAVADLNGDALPEIVLACRNATLGAYRISGEPLVLATLDAGVVGTVMLADIDGDSRPEMVAGTTNGTLWVVRNDGTSVEGWPVSLESPVISGAALVETDAGPHLAWGTRAGKLHLLDARGIEAPGWPVSLAGEVWTEPVVADLDDDGAVEILCAAKGSVYVIGLDGTTRPLYSGTALVRSALLALDMDGNASLEAVFATSDMKVHVVTLAGTHLSGWPKALQGSSFAGLAAADLDGGGLPELLCTTDGDMCYFLDGNGAVLPPSPIRLALTPLSPPTLADLDGDGDLELVVGTDSGVLALDQKTPGARPCWATHRVNLSRTGVYVRDTATAKPPASLPTLAVLAVSPVPCRDHVVVRFRSPAGRRVSLQIYDLAGRLILRRAVVPAGSLTEERLWLEGLPPGTYRLCVEADAAASAGTVVRVR